jgi:hypothetical protein
MKATSYLANLASKIERKNDWYTVKAGTGAVAVEETTVTEAMRIGGEIHDMSVLDPADLLERFEEYEDPEFDGDEWGIL